MIHALAFVLISWAQEGPEERVDDSEYEKVVALHVRALDAVEKAWKKDPVAALRALEPVLKAVEADLVPRLPRVIESVIAVKATRGIDKGEIKERRPFFPYRLAGEIALAAGEPERAMELLRKSPSSAARLEEARKAVEAKKAPPVPAPPGKPLVELKPYFDRRDYVGALEAIRAQRAGLGPDADRLSEEVRREAAAGQKSVIGLLAGLLPRLDQDGFRKNHVEPCLEACARIPEDYQSEELRWVRRLDRWLETRDPAEFEKLALAASKFGGDFTILSDRAQDARLAEADRLVRSVSEAERSERPRLLVQLGQVERAFLDLAAGHDRPAARERFTALKAKLPIDDKVLEEARAGASSIADIRRLADELDRLWDSDRRARLSVPDQKDLMVYLGVYRSMTLFLDGRSIQEAARDVRLREVFRGSPELPADVSPKVLSVRSAVNR